MLSECEAAESGRVLAIHFLTATERRISKDFENPSKLCLEKNVVVLLIFLITQAMRTVQPCVISALSISTKLVLICQL